MTFSTLLYSPNT